MSSRARSSFLVNLEAFKSACDLSEVQGANPLGDFFRRGMTVAAYNLLETFIDERWTELAAHMNGGQTQFIDLPEKIQKRAIRQTLNVAHSKLQRTSGELDLADLRDFSRDVGASLGAVDRHLQVSPFTWMWPGSNMSAEDLATGLRHVHVEKPWEQILTLTTRLGFPATQGGVPIDLKSDLHALAQERHKCAHRAQYGVTSLWLRAIPSRILRFAIGFDCLASFGADRIRRGDLEFLGNDTWLKSEKISLRKVQQRSKDYAEFKEGKAKAVRRSTDGYALFGQACQRASELELVALLSLTGEVCDWSIPGAG